MYFDENDDKSLSYLTGFSLNVNYIQTLKKEINFSNEITLKMHIRNYSIVTNVNEVDRYLNSTYVETYCGCKPRAALNLRMDLLLRLLIQSGS